MAPRISRVNFSFKETQYVVSVPVRLDNAHLIAGDDPVVLDGVPDDGLPLIFIYSH